MTLPLLMGSAPLPPIQLCFDCGAYFWLGFIIATVLAVVLALAFAHHHHRKG